MWERSCNIFSRTSRHVSKWLMILSTFCCTLGFPEVWCFPTFYPTDRPKVCSLPWVPNLRGSASTCGSHQGLQRSSPGVSGTTAEHDHGSWTSTQRALVPATFQGFLTALEGAWGIWSDCSNVQAPEISSCWPPVSEKSLKFVLRSKIWFWDSCLGFWHVSSMFVSDRFWDFWGSNSLRWVVEAGRAMPAAFNRDLEFQGAAAPWSQNHQRVIHLYPFHVWEKHCPGWILNEHQAWASSSTTILAYNIASKILRISYRYP